MGYLHIIANAGTSLYFSVLTKKQKMQKTHLMQNTHLFV